MVISIEGIESPFVVSDEVDGIVKQTLGPPRHFEIIIHIRTIAVVGTGRGKQSKDGEISLIGFFILTVPKLFVYDIFIV